MQLKFLIPALILSYFNLNAQIKSESKNKNYSIGSVQTAIEHVEKTYKINGSSKEILDCAESNVKYYRIGNASVTSSESDGQTFLISDKTDEEVSNNGVASNQPAFVVPNTKQKNENTFALIIGNEDYKSYQTGLSTEQNVDFAINDARLIKEICEKTLGLPQENILYLENAGYIKIKQSIEQLQLICKYAKSPPTLIFYYAGHGLPHEQTKVPYLIPVDVSGLSLDYAISLPDLYTDLTRNKPDKAIVFLDACFTGEARNTGLVASRGVKIVPKQTVVNDNLVVFSASSSDQSSKPYDAKQHGMFTYFLAKKIIETKGIVTLGELSAYIGNEVPLKSVLINKTEQVPVTSCDEGLKGAWKAWNLF